MIRGVIFDLGSTLMYWDGDGKEIDAQANAALSAFLRTHGISVGADFPALFHAARADGWKLAEETNIEHTIAEALGTALAQLGHRSLDGLLPRAVEQFVTVGEKYQHVYPESVEALARLKERGLRVGLISNADDDELVQRAVVRLGFAPYLDPVTSSAGLRWRKPNPDIFHYVANLWQLAPREIAMVGDAPRYDVLGAHNAGMRGILIDRNENHWWQKIPEESANDPAMQPDATVRDLLEILDIIERL
ncbi:MAG: HAD family hydrolase [Chloroflexi bacterium]|nr:HAD family hydrolase [Chloroflexota bacterium]